jgi:hypothetical protein
MESVPGTVSDLSGNPLYANIILPIIPNITIRYITIPCLDTRQMYMSYILIEGKLMDYSFSLDFIITIKYLISISCRYSVPALPIFGMQFAVIQGVPDQRWVLIRGSKS